MDKNLDFKGRWRNKTISFRVSEEENNLLNNCVAATGLTKQDYIIRRLLNRDVVVQPNPRVYMALKNQMKSIYEELKKFDSKVQLGEEFLYTIQFISEILDGFKGEEI